MKQQVAELFTKMGFDIDLTELDKLDKHIRSMRASSTLLARNLRVLNGQLNTTKTHLKGVSQGLNAVSSKKNANGLATAYKKMSQHVDLARKALTRFTRTLGILEPRLDAHNTRMTTLTSTWTRYVETLRDANRQLIDVRRNSADVRAAPTIINRGGRGGSNGGGSGGGRGGGADDSLLGGGMMAAFLRPFTPTGLLVGGGATAGVAVKEIVQAGREVQKMKQAMLVATGSTTAQGDALDYVGKQANRLGVSYVDMGKAYASARLATEGKLDDQQLQKMMTGVAEFSATMHLTADDQKGVFKAMTQMFSKNKISLEEVNQMAERGIPALKLMQEETKKFYKVDDAGFFKMIQKGQILTKDIFPRMADRMAELARKGGALDKAMHSSTAEQQRFTDAMKKAAAQIMENGLDAALGKMFQSLTSLVPLFTAAADGVGDFATAVKDLVGFIQYLNEQYPTLMSGLASLIAMFAFKKVILASLGRAVGMFVAAYVLGMRRVVWSTMIAQRTLTRFPLFLIFMALFELFRAFGQYLKGEDNWLTFLVKLLGLGALKIQLLVEKIKTFFFELKRDLIKMFPDDFFDRFNADKMGIKINKDSDGSALLLPKRPFDSGIPYKNDTNPQQVVKHEVNVNGQATAILKDSYGTTVGKAVMPLTRLDMGGLRR